MRSVHGYTVFPGISARAVIGRRAVRVLNRGERLSRFSLKKLANDLVVPGKFTTFNKSAAIGKPLKEEITPFFDNTNECWRLFAGGRLFEEKRYS